MRARAIGIACAVALAGALAGCPGRGVGDAIYVEEFEELCEGTPCGWSQSGGPDESARYVETLPGDHGLELIGDGVTVRGGPGEALASPRFASTIAARAIARCDLGSSIEVRVSVELADGRPLTFGTEIVPDDSWERLLPDQGMNPLEPIPLPWRIARVLGVAILKRGTGTCEIDYLLFRAI